MLIKVKTLTGKEIELDIEPTDKVERIKEKVRIATSDGWHLVQSSPIESVVSLPV